MEEKISNAAVQINGTADDKFDRENYLDTDEVAELLQKTRKAVELMRDRKKLLPDIKFSRKWYYLKEKVYQFKAELDTKKTTKNTGGTTAFYLFDVQNELDGQKEGSEKILNTEKIDSEIKDEVQDNNGTTDNAADDVSEGNDELKVEIVNTQEIDPPKKLETLTYEIRYFMRGIVKDIIEVGKRLIDAKEIVPHGLWKDWLKDNFNLKRQSAQNFMNLARRFGHDNDFNILAFNTTQAVEMLALPAGDENNFVAAMNEKGTPAEYMTTKELRKAIFDWNNKSAGIDAAQSDMEKLVKSEVDATPSDKSNYQSNGILPNSDNPPEKELDNASVAEVFQYLKTLQEILPKIDSTDEKVLGAAIKKFIADSDENSFLEMAAMFDFVKTKLDDVHTSNDYEMGRNN